MSELRTVVFRGPGPFHAMRHPAHGFLEFVAGEPKAVIPEVANYVLSLNPANATLDNAVDKGCRIYDELDDDGNVIDHSPPAPAPPSHEDLEGVDDPPANTEDEDGGDF